MASFTDRAPTFNPYVQQQPVEAMVNVGLQMQQRYDQNLQKIQSTIENIAGLDVVRDVDKRYLESRLTNVGNKLTSFAAADFSQSEMANSVGGMVGIIGKDANVRNAVSSTNRYKKALANKEQYTKEGKNGESNDWLFRINTNKWLNSEDLSASYNGDYRKFKDYSKPAQEIIKNLVKDSVTNDVAYSYDNKGNITSIHDAITRKKIEGITPEKIQRALKAGLSAEDWQQMQLDGRYKYSNVSNEDFMENITSSYDKNITNLKESQDNIKSLIISASSASEKQRLTSRLKSLEGLIQDTENDYKKTEESFLDGNLEGTKAQLFIADWMSNMSNGFSSSIVSTTFHESPYANRQYQRDKMAQDDRHHSENLDVARERLFIAKEKKKKENPSPDPENPTKSPFGPVPFPTDSKKLTNIKVIAKEYEAVENMKNRDEISRNSMINKYGWTDNEFQEKIILFEKNKAKLTYSQQKDIKQYLTDYSETFTKERTLNTHQKTAEFLYQDNINPDENLPEVLKNKTIDLNFENEFGKSSTVSYDYIQAAREFLNFEKNYQTTKYNKDSYYISSPEGGRFNVADTGEKVYLDDKALAELPPEKQAMYNLWKKSTQGYTTELEGRQLAAIKEVARNVKTNLETIENNRNKYVSEQLKETHVIMQPNSYSILLTDDNVMAGMKTVLGDLGIRASEDKLEGTDVSQKNIVEMASKLETVSIVGEDKKTLNLSGKDGTFLSIPLDNQTNLSVFGDEYTESPSERMFNQRIIPMLHGTQAPLVEMWDERTESVVVGKNPQTFWTTNINSTFNSTFATGGLNSVLDFTNVDAYNVTGDVVSDSKNGEIVTLKINVRDPITDEVVLEDYELAKDIEKSALDAHLKWFTDEKIFKILYPYGNWEEKKEELENAKKIIK